LCFRFLELAQYHFYAEEWDMCYRTLITNLVADSIINGERRKLGFATFEANPLLLCVRAENFSSEWELLRELQKHSHEIDGWHVHGQVYFSYLLLREELERLKHRSAEDKLEAIMQKVVSVCTQLRHMPCGTPKER
jgi:hypothetical protein